MHRDQLPGGILSSMSEIFRVRSEDNHVVTCEVTQGQGALEMELELSLARC